jgi:amino-acid N-acetyltransferase
MKLARIDHTDLSAIRSLLAEAALPHSDITAEGLQHFIALRDDNGVHGVVGLERYGSIALLRSLVVAPELRGHGYGIELTKAAESLSRDWDVAAIYLLTTTADVFFQNLGYRRVARESVPDEIQRTTEFSSLCPSSAIVMVKP